MAGRGRGRLFGKSRVGLKTSVFALQYTTAAKNRRRACHEHVTLRQVIGALVCGIGLFLICN